MIRHSQQGGYVALMAVLVVGAICVAAATSILTIGSDRQRSALALQQSVQARNLASACAEEALQQLQINQSFSGTNSLAFTNGTCSYTVTNTGGTGRSITSSGTIKNVVRKIVISATIGTLSISIMSWQDSQ